MTETEQVIEETQAEEVVTEPEDSTVYTRERQMIDQERANAARARAELAAVTEAYEESNNRITQLEQELSRRQTEIQTEKDRLDEMDPDLIDPKVIANIKRLEDAQLKRDRELDELRQKVAANEAEKAQLAEEQRRSKTREEVLTYVDDQVGAQYRSEALKLADEWVDSGKEKQPSNVMEGIRLMTKCYKEAKARAEKAKPKTVSVDTGKSGTGTATRQTRKTGSLDEVVDDMARDKSWKDD